MNSNFQVGQQVVFNFVFDEPQDNGVVQQVLGNNQLQVLSEGVVLVLDVYQDQVFGLDTWENDYWMD